MTREKSVLSYVSIRILVRERMYRNMGIRQPKRMQLPPELADLLLKELGQLFSDYQFDHDPGVKVEPGETYLGTLQGLEITSLVGLEQPRTIEWPTVLDGNDSAVAQYMNEIWFDRQ